ncbi:MAG: DUF2177 family protein [Thermodesulfobacteriota bacterium]
MSAAKLLVVYGGMLASFLVIDLVWLGVVARSMYQKHLGYLMAPQVNWGAAIVFYLIFVFGLFFFAVLPGIESRALAKTLVSGCLFGLICYATYDLTNLATVRQWPLTITLIDMAWGAVLSTCVTATGFSLGKWLSS